MKNKYDISLSSNDRRLLKLGFAKVSETLDYVEYQKYDTKYEFTHCLSISFKLRLNDYMIHSYVLGTNSDGFNNVVGITTPLLKVLYSKACEMKLHRKLKL